MLLEISELKWKKSLVWPTVLFIAASVTVTIIFATVIKLIHHRGLQSRPTLATEALIIGKNLLSLHTIGNRSDVPLAYDQPTKGPLTQDPPTQDPPTRDPSTLDPQNIYPSRKDKRKYLFHIIPKNNLRVLLVWDPDTTAHSAAAMSVGVGFQDDPLTHNGLAHLCEHMLEMGSEKYPDADAYKKLIDTYGGRMNAQTGPEYTLYHFNAPMLYFPTVLDSFAQSFVSPLFPDKIIQREIEVIHQEYLLKLTHGNVKFKRLLDYVSNPSNPMHQFHKGDNITLSKRDIQYQLKKFFHMKYSARNVSSM